MLSLGNLNKTFFFPFFAPKRNQCEFLFRNSCVNRGLLDRLYDKKGKVMYYSFVRFMWADEENFNAHNIYTERDILKVYKVFFCCLIKDGLGTLREEIFLSTKLCLYK